MESKITTNGLYPPIAIIGMACRFPQASSVGDFWAMLQSGTDAIQEVPPDRWAINDFYDANVLAPGKMNTKWGGFLANVADFDADFFGIAPMEAVQMSPQQRILLEVAWEALEDAGLATDRLAGLSAGTYIGVASFDYYERMAGDPKLINRHSLTGNAYSITANRLAYVLNLRGPSIAIDTACSSSLVAVHLACQSLHSGETGIAIAGGTQVMVAPWLTVAASKGESISPDGRCKTFDASANGYVRGEGAGIVVLKMFDRAIADEDRIWAVIRSTAVNQNGRCNGLTAPNPSAQQDLLRDAYRVAGISPAKVGYVEAHGTATPLGDSIEMNALGAVLCAGRSPDKPCLVGSVKTNFGHLEAAAGIAGLIKAALVTHYGLIPPNLHFHNPNPLIDFKRYALRVPQQLTKWSTSETRIAGVSSFGFGGTNSHIVIEQAPERAVQQPDGQPPALLLCLSAKSELSLRNLANKYIDFFENEKPNVAELTKICFRAGLGRSHFNYRLAVGGSRLEEFQTSLTHYLTGRLDGNAVSGRVKTRDKNKIAFLFSGQGCQYPAMGKELFETQPLFRNTLHECDELLRPFLSTSIIDLLYGADTDQNVVSVTAHAEPLIFVIQVALVRLLGSWGIIPSVVMGHGVGEFAAGYAAGLFDVATGLALVAQRGQLIQRLCEPGRMASIFADETTVLRAMANHPALAIAAVNGPRNIVISGASQQLENFLEQIRLSGIGYQLLSTSHGFHSSLMQPAVSAFGEVVSKMTFRPPAIRFVSTLTGNQLAGNEDFADYTRRQLVEPVHFSDGMSKLCQLGIESFVEIGPKPVLSAVIRPAIPQSALCLATLSPPQGDWHSLLHLAGSLYARGLILDWKGLQGGVFVENTLVPTYAFDRQRYWVETPPIWTTSLRQMSTKYPAFKCLEHANNGSKTVVQISLTNEAFPELHQHKMFGHRSLPSTFYLAVAKAAATEIFGHVNWCFREVEFPEPFFVQSEHDRLILVLKAAVDGQTKFSFSEVNSQFESGSRATRVYASGMLQADDASEGHALKMF